MSTVLELALSTWDDVDAHLPAIIHALGQDSPAAKQLEQARADVKEATTALFSSTSEVGATAGQILPILHTAIRLASPLLPPPVTEAVESALATIEHAIAELTPVGVPVTVEHVHAGAPPAVVDGAS